MSTTVEMTTQMFKMLQSIAKRMDAQDIEMAEMKEMLKRKARKRSNPLEPFKDGLRAVNDICSVEIKATDQKVFIGLICPQVGEDTASKAPIFSLTANIFREFMELYNEAEDGEKVAVPDEAVFTRRYAERCVDTWTMPETLK